MLIFKGLSTVLAFVSTWAYGQDYDESRIVSCVINDVDGKHIYKDKTEKSFLDVVVE